MSERKGQTRTVLFSSKTFVTWFWSYHFPVGHQKERIDGVESRGDDLLNSASLHLPAVDMLREHSAVDHVMIKCNRLT